MADALVRLKVESSEYDQKIKRASRALTELTANAKREGESVAFADKKNIELARSLGQMQTLATSAKGKMAELTTAFQNAAHSYNQLSQAEKQGAFGKALNASVSQLEARIKSLRTEMNATQSRLGGAGGGIGGSIMGGMSAGLSTLGPYAVAAAGVTAAISGMKKVIGDVVQINMQFEQSTANLAAVMGTTRDQVAALTNQAKQLGATTQYTAVQITELQTNLARLGFTQQEILNSTKSVSALATATGADLGEAANLAGAALRAFGMDSSEMERVASVLAVSTTKSALSFEKLATAVPIVSPVAKQFGFEIEDVVTLLGKLSDAGFDASSAATASRNIFLNMANSSGKLAQALGRPIKSIEDLAPALSELKSRGIDLAEMLELTDKRSVAAFATFVEGADTMVALKNSVTDCSDALQGMVDEQLNTLQGSVTILSSAWEGLMLTFSQSNGVIKGVVDGLTNLLSAWTTWRKRNQGGDAAISTYELGLTEEKKKEADEFIAAEKASGKSAEAIAADAKTKKDALEAEAEALKKLEKEYKAYEEQLKIARNSGDVEKAVGMMDSNPLKGTAYIGKGKSFETIYKDIAALNDSIAMQDYIAGAMASSSTTMAGEAGGTTTGGAGSVTADLKAKYMAEEKAQIAALDRMAMTEEEYEQKVYEIKRTYAQMTVDLYNEGTKERYQAEAALSNLEIQHQAQMMRGRKKTKTETEGPAMAGPGMSQFEKLQQSLAIKMADQMAGVDEASLSNLMMTALQHGIDNFNPDFENLQYKMAEGLNIPDEAWIELTNKINEELKNLGLDPIKLDVKTGGVSNVQKEANATADAWQNAVSAVGQLGGAIQQIEDPTAKVAGIIAQAIANIALTFATSLKGTVTPWDWIAAAVSGTATMISTISAIKSATSGSYASGGIIPGNSFSGDNLTASVNSGELILNRAQQANLAGQLSQGSLNDLQLSTSLSGETIRIALGNSARRRGGARGEYAITK